VYKKTPSRTRRCVGCETAASGEHSSPKGVGEDHRTGLLPPTRFKGVAAGMPSDGAKTSRSDCSKTTARGCVHKFNSASVEVRSPDLSLTKRVLYQLPAPAMQAELRKPSLVAESKLESCLLMNANVWTGGKFLPPRSRTPQAPVRACMWCKVNCSVWTTSPQIVQARIKCARMRRAMKGRR
jgi:hypothetical protein